MLKTFYLYSQYRKYNKEIAKRLGIKRDRKYEYFILFKLGRSNTNLENKLKENFGGFIKYYKKRNKFLDFEAMNYIVCRIMATFMVTQDEKVLELEQENFSNPFCEQYIRKKIEWLRNDTFFINHDISNAEAVM